MRGDDYTYLHHLWEMGILFKEGSKGETCPPLFMGRTWHYIIRLSPMACCLWSESVSNCAIHIVFLLSLSYLVKVSKDHNTLHARRLFPFPFIASIWPTYEGVSAFEVVSTRLSLDHLYLSTSTSCLFWEKVLLCIPGSSGTHHVDQADYRDLPISGLLSGGIKGMLTITNQCLWSYLPRPFAM